MIGTTGVARLRVGGLAAAWAALTAFQAAPTPLSGRLVSADAPDVTVTAAASPGLAAPAPALRRYLDGAGGFSLDVPAGWAVRKETGSSEVTLLRGDATISASADPAEPGDADEASEMAALFAQNIRGQCPAAEISTPQTTGLAGLKGLAFVSTCAGPRKPTTGQFMFAQADGRILSFNFVAPTADTEALKPVLTWVLVSLQLTSRPPARPHTPDSTARWVEAVKDACRAGVFSQTQCAVRLADALREQAQAKP